MSLAVQIVVEDTKSRVLDYLKNPTQGQTFGHLMLFLGFGRAERGNREKNRVDGVAHSRILDRALQSLRKAGKIQFADRQWKLTVDP
jgi:hypothetical protein